MKLKICGIKHRENARQLLTLEPDYLGFIFYEKSPRHAGNPEDLDWVKNIPATVRKVGVFVNAGMEAMKNTAAALGLHIVQLHGEEPPEVAGALKAEGLEVWKVFGVDEAFDFEKTRPYCGVADKFLFDTKGKNRGGNGVAFDWSLLDKYAGEKPFVLSGGIGPEDAKMISDFGFRISGKLHGVDINSRFETTPGLKDFDLVKKFKHELFS